MEPALCDANAHGEKLLGSTGKAFIRTGAGVRPQRRWGQRSKTGPHCGQPRGPGPKLGTKCCSCATQWAQRELYAPASPAAARACGSSPRQLRTMPGEESMLVSGCSQACARNEATFSKRRNQNGSNTRSADEDGNVYYFSGALNFPGCPCSGPGNCFDSLQQNLDFCSTPTRACLGVPG